MEQKSAKQSEARKPLKVRNKSEDFFRHASKHNYFTSPADSAMPLPQLAATQGDPADSITMTTKQQKIENLNLNLIIKNMDKKLLQCKVAKGASLDKQTASTQDSKYLTQILSPRYNLSSTQNISLARFTDKNKSSYSLHVSHQQPSRANRMGITGMLTARTTQTNLYGSNCDSKYTTQYPASDKKTLQAHTKSQHFKNILTPDSTLDG